jgi:hypothetical protein
VGRASNEAGIRNLRRPYFPLIIRM